MSRPDDLLKSQLRAARDRAATAPTDFEADGMAWWNSLSEPERRQAIENASVDASVADAYRWHLLHNVGIWVNSDSLKDAAPELADALRNLLREAADDGITDRGVHKALRALRAAGVSTREFE